MEDCTDNDIDETPATPGGSIGETVEKSSADDVFNTDDPQELETGVNKEIKIDTDDKKKALTNGAGSKSNSQRSRKGNSSANDSQKSTSSKSPTKGKKRKADEVALLDTTDYGSECLDANPAERVKSRTARRQRKQVDRFDHNSFIQTK